jgi:acylphosphatase
LLIAVRLRIKGVVHGVAFRATMAEVAKGGDVAGWVRNDADGSVEALLEGNEAEVMKVVEWARRGPPSARVDSLDVRNVPAKNLRGFKIAG